MYQIDDSTAVTTQPTPTALGTVGFFTDGNAATGEEATIVPAEFLNSVMLEILNAIEGAGLTPSKSTYNQLYTAISAIGQSGAANYSADTGAVNAYAATFSPSVAAPSDGMFRAFKVKTTNTGASTFALDGSTATYPIYGLNGTALQGGELVAGGIAVVRFNSSLAASGAWVLYHCGMAATQVAPATKSNHAVQMGQVQSGALNYAVAGGSSDALTAAVASSLTALSDGLSITVKAAVANATTTPTFALTLGSTATAAATIVKGAGAALSVGDIAGANHELLLTYNTTLAKWVLNNPATGVVSNSGHQIQPLGAAVASSALTVSLGQTSLDFRSATASSGTVSTVTTTAALSLTVPSGATLGSTAATAATYAVLAINNGGTLQLGLVNMAGSVSLDETALISTTAMSAAATSASVVYSATAVTSMPFRVVGYITATEATAGVWATAPSAIQGGVALSQASAASLYLSKTSAASTYLSQTSAASTYQAALGYTPVQQAGGTSMLSANKVYIGWSGSNLLAQVDTTAQGYFWLSGAAGSSIAASGYQKLPSGLIFQWCVVSSVANGGTGSATFPITFPSACVGCWLSSNVTTSGTNNNHVYNWSTSGATVYNGDASTSSMYVFALGY